MTTWRPGETATIDGTFDKALAEGSDRPFLDFSGSIATYGEVARLIARTAGGLAELGVRRGDTVVTVLDNHLDAVVTFLAANRLGAIAVPVNTAYRGEFLRHQIADAGAEVVIAERDYLPRIQAVAEGLPQLRSLIARGGRSEGAIDLAELRTAGSDELPAPVASPGDLACLIYTAGTTGPSKGCMISHNYVVNVARQYLNVVTRRPDEHTWTPLPLFHYNAWTVTVVPSMLLGSSASIAPRFSLSGFWPEIERSKASMVSLLGPMVSLIAQAPDSEAMRRCRGQLRIVQSAPFPRDYIQIWQDRFGAQLAGTNVFGLSECCLTTSHPLDRPAPPGSSGRRNEDFDVRIFDEEDREVPAGEVGEICVRPRRANVMFEGYWRRPEATAALSRNWWFHTGDLGRFDADGFFYFVDRKKDYLRRRGENISSFEMETAILQHPDVVEVAVHAVPSEVTEDDVKVTAVLRKGAGLTCEELCRWSIDRLPYFAVPRYIEFRDDLPRNPVGRVLKYVLRDEGVTERTWDRERSDLVITKR
ncbi:MAG TPA: AMP-binding protein [Pseudonocardiaceae bacterium]|jgi:crotonobetaine/carnitine-CoA ligase|nr:AMP-binding protein [Pseudonocardiaceae bacterium]